MALPMRPAARRQRAWRAQRAAWSVHPLTRHSVRHAALLVASPQEQQDVDDLTEATELLNLATALLKAANELVPDSVNALRRRAQTVHGRPRGRQRRQPRRRCLRLSAPVSAAFEARAGGARPLVGSVAHPAHPFPPLAPARAPSDR
jgi:hypothetical protein